MAVLICRGQSDELARRERKGGKRENGILWRRVTVEKKRRSRTKQARWERKRASRRIRMTGPENE